MVDLKGPGGLTIREIFRDRFGLDLEEGLRRLEELAGNAIGLDNGCKQSGFHVGTCRLSDNDFALLAFFAGVGRFVLLGEVEVVRGLAELMADEDRALPALTSKVQNDKG